MNFADIKNLALAKIDISNVDNEMSSSFSTDIVGKFRMYADEAMQQICSAVKPKRSFWSVEFNPDIDEVHTVPRDFISFGDDICYIEYDVVDLFGTHTVKREATSEDFEYEGLSSILFKTPGRYTISYNALWIDFLSGDIDDNDELDCPRDVLVAIPSFIAAECWKIDDQYRAAVFRNEFEIALSRLNDNDYKRHTSLHVRGDW